MSDKATESLAYSPRTNAPYAGKVLDAVEKFVQSQTHPLNPEEQGKLQKSTGDNHAAKGVGSPSKETTSQDPSAGEHLNKLPEFTNPYPDGTSFWQNTKLLSGKEPARDSTTDSTAAGKGVAEQGNAPGKLGDTQTDPATKLQPKQQSENSDANGNRVQPKSVGSESAVPNGPLGAESEHPTAAGKHGATLDDVSISTMVQAGLAELAKLGLIGAGVSDLATSKPIGKGMSDHAPTANLSTAGTALRDTAKAVKSTSDLENKTEYLLRFLGQLAISI